MLFAFVYPNCAPKTSEILRKHILTNIVKVEDRNGQLYVIGIIEESGHSTIRIVFFDKTIIQQTENELIRLGCDFEGSDNPNLIAIDIPPEVNYKETIKSYLDQGKNADLWDYEEVCLASKQNQ